jgi:hypothetical protein
MKEITFSVYLDQNHFWALVKKQIPILQNERTKSEALGKGPDNMFLTRSLVILEHSLVFKSHWYKRRNTSFKANNLGSLF